VSSASRHLFRSTCLPTVSPADLLAELDPRSLDPDRSFWSAFAELIWNRNAAYRLLQLHNIDVRATKPYLDSSRSRRDGDLDLLPFLSHHASLASGGEWRAALFRSFVSAPVLVLPSCPGLPNRDASSIAPPSRLASRCIARINVHRSKDRVKDASSIDHMQRALDSCLRGVRTLCGARLTNVPLLGVASDIRCHRRAFTAGGYPL
jgi:hypothetical protein